MRERKFYFIPLKNDIIRKTEKESLVPYCAISKSGSIQFTTRTIEYFGFKTGTILKFFCDIEKRALAFRVVERLENGELKEYKSGGYKECNVRDNKGSKVLVLFFGKFILSLPNSKLPSGKIKIEKYKDNELGIELYYFIVPENNDSLKPKINPYYKPGVDN